MATFQPVMPHGDIEEAFPDVFFVTGTTRPTFMGASWQFSRNMTVVREDGALTIINSVRLDDAGLAKLDALGKVEHVVKLGAFHGMDDAFYRDRYGAKQWALPKMVHDGGHETDHELVSGGPTPFAAMSLFVFESAKLPEGIILIDRDGGVLVSCDSLQNWAEPDRFFSEESAEKMKQLGFIQPANIGPGWKMASEPASSDFARLKGLSFNHLLPGHGAPLRGDAHERFAARFEKDLGV